MPFAVYVKLKLSNDIGFFQEFLRKNHLLRAYYLRLDWSGGLVLIKSEIPLRREWSGRSVLTIGDKWVNYVAKMLIIFQQRSFRFRIRDLKPSYHRRVLLSDQYVTGYFLEKLKVRPQNSLIYKWLSMWN